MHSFAYALSPGEFLRSVRASRQSLGKRPIKLLDLVTQVQRVSGGADYAVVGGIAQILWARKTHTDDMDLVLAKVDADHAYQRIAGRRAPAGWPLPKPPDRALESDKVFQVYHLLYRGAVVDLLSFHDTGFTAEIIASARTVTELDGVRFIRPELLLVTHLLRPGPMAALAAVELTIARRSVADLDLADASRWAARLGREEALRRTLLRADEFSSSST